MVDFTFHYTFTKNYQNELPLIGHIKGQGISAFKAFTYYDNTALKPGDFREIMSALKDRGTLLIHGEEKTIIDIEKAKVKGKEQENMLHLSLTRPNVSELIAVETVLALAKESGVSICIAHTSAGGTADIRKREHLAGNDRFILETCPHYLYLTRDKLSGSRGALFTMNPPLRGGEDNERLWQAVLEGDISILSTDHCPYLKQYKTGKTFLTVPCGVDGVQTRMLFLFSEGVKKRNLPLEEFVKITSTNAALFYKLYPKKGVIRKGSDADLVIIDPDAEWIWDASSIAGATDYSVLDGLRLTGKISQVIKGGNTAVKDGVVVAQKGSGKFIRAEGV
jgi:dihydropyrimidinase